MSNVNNDLFYQASTLLTSVVEQATGRAVARPTNVGEFVSVATTALQGGYDPIMRALTQMWGRTIFAVRPYGAKLRGMEMDLDRFANVTRKISFADKPIEPDQRFIWPAGYDASVATNPLGNGESVDMWKIHKDDPLQVQFYGQSVYQDVRTEFVNSLDAAFRSPEEFLRYNAAAVQNRQNKLEQYRENVARAVLLNLIGSLYYISNATGALADQTRVIHLITEYNAKTGLTLTAQTAMQPDNYPGFMRWVYARLASLSDLMASRSSMYQTTVNGKTINRHTDAENTKIYILSEYLHEMDSMARSVTFHEDLLAPADVEGVPYWQAIKSPDVIDLGGTVSLTGADGSVITAAAGTGTLSNVFGVVFDRDAAGYSFVNRFDWATPGINAAGGYYNMFHHANVRTIQDTTEKSVLLLMD
jgi:hypothetical protein